MNSLQFIFTRVRVSRWKSNFFFFNGNVAKLSASPPVGLLWNETSISSAAAAASLFFNWNSDFLWGGEIHQKSILNSSGAVSLVTNWQRSDHKSADGGGGRRIPLRSSSFLATSISQSMRQFIQFQSSWRLPVNSFNCPLQLNHMTLAPFTTANQLV